MTCISCCTLAAMAWLSPPEMCCSAEALSPTRRRSSSDSSIEMRTPSLPSAMSMREGADDGAGGAPSFAGAASPREPSW